MSIYIFAQEPGRTVPCATLRVPRKSQPLQPPASASEARTQSHGARSPLPSPPSTSTLSSSRTPPRPLPPALAAALFAPRLRRPRPLALRGTLEDARAAPLKTRMRHRQLTGSVSESPYQAGSRSSQKGECSPVYHEGRASAGQGAREKLRREGWGMKDAQGRARAERPARRSPPPDQCARKPVRCARPSTGEAGGPN